MPEVSTFRLYILRAAYLLIAVGLALMVWPRLINHTADWALRRGDTFGLLAGIQVLAMLGILYPLKMIPLLLFELVWKAIWLVAIAMPLWSAGQIDPGTAESIKACVMGVVVSVIAIPWPYFMAAYVKAPMDRWTGRGLNT
jgi:hypothetical protein